MVGSLQEYAFLVNSQVMLDWGGSGVGWSGEHTLRITASGEACVLEQGAVRGQAADKTR